MSFKWSTAFIQPGPSHSNQRKMLRRGIGPQSVGSYDPSIEVEVAKLMEETLKVYPILPFRSTWICFLLRMYTD
jgi:cytochrome P450